CDRGARAQRPDARRDPFAAGCPAPGGRDGARGERQCRIRPQEPRARSLARGDQESRMTTDLDPAVGPCPSDERLAELVENRLSGAPRPELERHVARCTACADVVATAATVALPSNDR